MNGWYVNDDGEPCERFDDEFVEQERIADCEFLTSGWFEVERWPRITAGVFRDNEQQREMTGGT